MDVEGIGFKTADKIALSNGVKLNSVGRIKGYIVYLLEDLAQSGDSYIYANELNDYIFEELGDREEVLELFYDDNQKLIGNNVASAIKELQSQGVIIVEEETEFRHKNERRVYLTKSWELENEIAFHLHRITTGDNNFNFFEWEKLIKLQEDEQGWCFTDQQLKGIEDCLKNSLFLLLVELVREKPVC